MTPQIMRYINSLNNNDNNNNNNRLVLPLHLNLILKDRLIDGFSRRFCDSSEVAYFFRPHCIYTVSQKKTRHSTHVDNFVKY